MYVFIYCSTIGSGQWPARYVEAHRANGPARHDFSLCVPGLGMSLGTWASPTRPEASTDRSWSYSYRAEMGSDRVRAGWPVWTSIAWSWSEHELVLVVAIRVTYCTNHFALVNCAF
jgi:hypothetical protein